MEVLCKDCGDQSLANLEISDEEVYVMDGGHKCDPLKKKPKGKHRGEGGVRDGKKRGVWFLQIWGLCQT
jgi:hypothetical protein